MKCKILSR